MRRNAVVQLAKATGSPVEVALKLDRFAGILFDVAFGHELDARLARLARCGIADRIPTRVQLTVGAVDMIRFWFLPTSNAYYAEQGVGMWWQSLLRFLEEPSSMVDAVGLHASRDNIIGHLLQVAHRNALYDLELLQMFDDGLDELERQLEQMLAGTHPRAEAIRAIVEETDYHERLLQFLRRWQRDPNISPWLRERDEASPRFKEEEEIFGALSTSLAYFALMPKTWLGAALHLMTVNNPMEYRDGKLAPAGVPAANMA